MKCEELNELLDAYVDRELDLMTSSRFDRHLAECEHCRTLHSQYQRMHETVSNRMEYFRAPEHLEANLRARLGLKESAAESLPVITVSRWRLWAAIAACAVGILLLAGLWIQLVHGPSSSEVLAHDVVSSHVRSLLASHLSDVVSTDQHTVKPWFNGKLDFAPVVKDLSSDGFPLVGGRLDYLDKRPVAALIYKRRQHTINLFTWPSQASDSSPRRFSIRGYHVLQWTHSQMTYWAVSDLNAAELDAFARDFEARP